MSGQGAADPDQFLYDLERQFPRLEKQQALVPDQATGARFHH